MLYYRDMDNVKIESNSQDLIMNIDAPVLRKGEDGLIYGLVLSSDGHEVWVVA